MLSVVKKAGILMAFSASLWAGNQITVEVTTNFEKAAAIGYKVDGKEKGGMGQSYSGKGPANMEYSFGMRKGSVFGKDVDCGVLFLTKNSRVDLQYNDDKCKAKLM